MKHIKFIAAFAVLATLGAPSAFAAGEPTIKGAALKIEQSHDELLGIKDNNAISPEERAVKEGLARKNIVSDAISLSMAEIQNLKNKLSKLPKFSESSTEAELKERYEEELSIYAEYYETQSVKLAGLNDAEAIKNLAKEIISYRDNIYNPAVSEIAEFTLLFYSEDTVNTAGARLSKIMTDIKKLEKLNIIKAGTFKAKSDKAAELIRNATSKYLKARLAIFAKAAAEKDKENIEKETSPTAVEIKNPAPSAKDLLEMSLTDVKSAYDIFLQISRDIKKLSGIK